MSAMKNIFVLLLIANIALNSINNKNVCKIILILNIFIIILYIQTIKKLINNKTAVMNNNPNNK